MRRARIVFGIVIVFFLICFLQANLFSWFNIRGVKPNLFVVLALFIGLNTNSKVGQIMGFILGLFTDFIFSESVGISAVLFMLVGFSGEFLQKRFPKNAKLCYAIKANAQ